jgi:hypothetical protein
MGSIIDLLALLDGWDYREVSGTITVKPNKVTEVFAEIVPGWLIGAAYTSTDAFGNLTVAMPPENFNIVETSLFDLYVEGATQLFPQSVVLTLFNFPSLPTDSSGFGEAVFNLVYPLPLKKNNVIHVLFALDPGTTQISAVINYSIVFAQILNMKVFQQGLKDIFNVKKNPIL